MKPEKEAPKKFKKLSTIERAEAVAMYERGVGVEEISEKFGRSPSAFFKMFKRLGTKFAIHKKDLDKEVADKVKSETVKTVVSDISIHANKVKTTKEEFYRIAKGLSALIWAEIMTARTEGRAAATATANLRALNLAASSISITRTEAFACLGILHGEDPTDEALPELTVREMNAEEESLVGQQRMEETKSFGMEDIDIPSLPEVPAV